MPSPGTWVRGGVWTAGLAGVLGRDHEGHLTNAAGLGDFVECPEQVASQLLDIDEVVEHGVGEVHQVVQVDGVALGPPEGHVEGSRLTWSQGKRHFLWAQLLLSPVSVLVGLGEALRLHDVVGRTALALQLLPGVAANRIGLPWPSEVLGGPEETEKNVGGHTVAATQD